MLNDSIDDSFIKHLGENREGFQFISQELFRNRNSGLERGKGPPHHKWIDNPLGRQEVFFLGEKVGKVSVSGRICHVGC